MEHRADVRSARIMMNVNSCKGRNLEARASGSGVDVAKSAAIRHPQSQIGSLSQTQNTEAANQSAGSGSESGHWARTKLVETVHTRCHSVHRFERPETL